MNLKLLMEVYPTVTKVVPVNQPMLFTLVFC